MTYRRRRSTAFASLLFVAMLPAPAVAAERVTWALHTTRADETTFSTTTPRPLSVHDFPAKHFDTTVNTVGATETGERAAVDVRGLRADGTWTEWVEASPGSPAVLPEATATVQARLVRTSGDPPRHVGLTAWHDPSARASVSAPSHGMTYRVFATREGLVGGTTANGHVITERDHFVALPSRRGLASRDSGNYTVKVCTSDGARCEWAPVWDVGPWNTRDDHWNADRESWPGLPRGKPQAQAAYSDGHNGGRDQFGRKVTNPAGIDLADGTFWDGLRLPTNSWVDVTYQWTGHGPWGTVVTGRGIQLNVRAAPTAEARNVGYAARHAQVRIECGVTGQLVHGSQGRSSTWYRLAPGKFVSGGYVRLGGAGTPREC